MSDQHQRLLRPIERGDGRRRGTAGGGPGGVPTRALRALSRSRKELAETRVVQVAGQLRANLEQAFPGAIGLFTKPASGISLAFLRLPTAAQAAWLSPGRLGSWLRSVGYTGGISASVLYVRLAAVAPGFAGPEGEARGQITLALVAMLTGPRRPA
jgi:hypothetical protein